MRTLVQKQNTKLFGGFFKMFQSKRAIYTTLGLGVLGLPIAIGLLKGQEKRLFWIPSPAEIERVDSTSITYVYVAEGKLFRHTQARAETSNFLPFLKSKPTHYGAGERVYVQVHPR